jgi:hypothetical protein
VTVGAAEDTEDLGGSGHRATGLAEFVALSLFGVECLVILGFIAAAIANQAQFGGQAFGVEGASSHVWGYTLSLASEWSSPGIVVAFLLGPLALVAWIRKRGGGDELTEARTRLAVRLALGLAVLTVLGGALSIVGRVLQFAPSENWASFFGILGTGAGAICLGIVGMYVAVRLDVPDPDGEVAWGDEDG